MFSVILVLLGFAVSCVELMHRAGVQFQAWFGIPLAFVGATLAVLAMTLSLRSQLVRGWLGGEWLARQLPWPRRTPFDHRD